MASLGGCGLDEIGHQLQHILVIPEIHEGIVSIALGKVHKVEDANVVPLAFEEAARGIEDFHLGIGDHHAASVALQYVGFDKPARLGRTAAADDQHIQVSFVFVSVQPQLHMAGQGFVQLLGEHGVDLLWRAPCGAAVFFAIPTPCLIGKIQPNAEDIYPGCEEQRYKAFIRPCYGQWVIERHGQVLNELGQAALSEALGQHQRQPSYGDIQKYAQEDISRARLLMGYGYHLFSGLWMIC